jgi:hypothetical protein
MKLSKNLFHFNNEYYFYNEVNLPTVVGTFFPLYVKQAIMMKLFAW